MQRLAITIIAVGIILLLGCLVFYIYTSLKTEYTTTLTSASTEPLTMGATMERTPETLISTPSTTTPSTEYISSPSPTETEKTVIEIETETKATYTETTTTPTTPVKPSINIVYSPKEGFCLDVVEVLFNVTGLSYSNPFNTSEIDVVGYITTPEGKTIAVPAFYTRNYTFSRTGSNEHIVVFTSPPLWGLRFTPLEKGEYKIRIKAVGNGLEIASDEITVAVKSCLRSRGFVRVDPGGRYLVFDDGSSEIMLGINLAWPPSRNEAISFYKRWFEKLKELGVKVVRIGLVPWSLNLEWSRINRYNLADAARIDEILRMAKENDIYVIFVFMWHNELADNWGDNPYNVAKGGILKSPEEFWINPVARKVFKDKVRYIVARWGCYPNILAWEVINEADLTTGFANNKDAFVEWLNDIANYIKSIDPYKRPVTVSLAYYGSEPRVWKLDSIDIVTVHLYGPTGLKDVANAISSVIKSLWVAYRKPVIVTEFGVDYRWIGMPGFTGTPYWALDREGVGFHEGLWSSALSGSPVVAMSWWWDVQIEKYNLFYHFKALSEFLKGVDPVNNRLSEANIVVKDAYTEKGIVASLTLYPAVGWISTPPNKQSNVYTIHMEGFIEGDTNLLSGFIYGKGHPQRVLNPIFKVRFLDRGRVIIHVNSVGRGSAVLVVYVNNSKALEVPLPDKDGKGDEAANEYNTDIVLEVEPGEYEIKIDNDGVDWFTWDYIVFENSVYAKAKVQVMGLNNNTFAMLWIRNKDYNWWNIVVAKRGLDTLKNITIELEGLEDGEYLVELWDTFTGTIIKTEKIVVINRRAEIHIELLEKDLGVKIYRRS